MKGKHHENRQSDISLDHSTGHPTGPGSGSGNRPLPGDQTRSQRLTDQLKVSYLCLLALNPNKVLIASCHSPAPGGALLAHLEAINRQMPPPLRAAILAASPGPKSTTTLETAVSTYVPPKIASELAERPQSKIALAMSKTLNFEDALTLLWCATVRDRLIRVCSESAAWKVKDLRTKIGGCGRNHLLLHHNDSFNDKYAAIPYVCNIRLCPFCSRERSRKRFFKMAPAIEEARRRRPDLKWRHIILTVPNCSGPELRQTTEAMMKAFRRMTNRPKSGWKDRVEGWLYNWEVTYNKKRKDYHPHIHVLAQGGFWKREDLSATWARYAAQRGLSPDPRLGVKIKMVSARPGQGLGAAIMEVCKYTVKPLEDTESAAVIEQLIEALHTSTTEKAPRLLLVGYGGAIAPRPEMDSKYWDVLGGMRKAVAKMAQEGHLPKHLWQTVLNSLEGNTVAYHAALRSYEEAEIIHKADLEGRIGQDVEQGGG